jgi:hypothetical protein
MIAPATGMKPGERYIIDSVDGTGHTSEDVPTF